MKKLFILIVLIGFMQSCYVKEDAKPKRPVVVYDTAQTDYIHHYTTIQDGLDAASEGYSVIILEPINKFIEECYNDSIKVVAANGVTSFSESKSEYAEYMPNWNRKKFQQWYSDNCFEDVLTEEFKEFATVKFSAYGRAKVGKDSVEYVWLHRQPTFEYYIEWLNLNN